MWHLISAYVVVGKIENKQRIHIISGRENEAKEDWRVCELEKGVEADV